MTIDLSGEFANSTTTTTRNAITNMDASETCTLYFDGGSRGNPGVAGAGMVIYADDNNNHSSSNINNKSNESNKEIWCGKRYLGEHKANNEAEYLALLTGLECALHLGIERIHVKGDSKLIVEQVSGRWDCRKPELRVLLQQVWLVRQKFRVFDISHVRREENRKADELANAAMDERNTD
jgi:ribonuclease HI